MEKSRSTFSMIRLSLPFKSTNVVYIQSALVIFTIINIQAVPQYPEWWNYLDG